MNIDNFPESVELMSYSGFKLTETEAALIENSLIILQSNNKFQNVFFVGRIETSSLNRYYIAFGFKRDILKDRKLFYSLNAYEWKLMPEVKPKSLPIALQTRSLFTGDPMNIENICMKPNFVPDDERVFIPCRRKMKQLKEEDRLACIVDLLMNESAIMPRGTLYKHVNTCVVFNPCFRGLNRLEASDMKNFQLFRHPINNGNFNLAKHDDYNYQTDFFDTIDDLIPEKCFSCQINDRDMCLIRALNWTGVSFFHKLNSSRFGFFYFGNGIKDLDLLFMT